MQTRAWAFALCVAALSATALLPAVAQAQGSAPAPTMHDTWWPGTVAAGQDAVGTPELMVPGIISPGLCPAVGSSKTFTFSYEDQGVVLAADGRFTERGSFTLIGTEEDALVTAFASTFSGSSPNGTIAGTRRMPDWFSPNSGVSCGGTSEADRLVGITLQRVDTEHRLTSASTGVVTVERGWAHLGLTSWAEGNTGHYFSWFRSDNDGDGWDLTRDNCPSIDNGDQLDADGDGAGDQCDADDDGDGLADGVDNCRLVANADQTDSDRDEIGDACDPLYGQDRDSDGVPDELDNCVYSPNPDQTDTGGIPARGDRCEDRDSDGVGDYVDNCRDAANPNQADGDGDAVGDACDPDCSVVGLSTQRDSDLDGVIDRCDSVFDSTDGFAGGGGKLAGGVHLSVALHSRSGSIHGSGHLADGPTTVRLLDVTGLRSDGDRAVAVGGASVDGGERVPYRVEIEDAANRFELEIGDRRWAGVLTNGNLAVK